MENISKKCKLSSCSELRSDSNRKIVLSAIKNMAEDDYSPEEWNRAYRYIIGDNGEKLTGRDRLISRMKYEEQLADVENRKREDNKIRKTWKTFCNDMKRISNSRKVMASVLVLLAIIWLRICIIKTYEAVLEFRNMEWWIRSVMIMFLILNFPLGYNIIRKVSEKNRELKRSGVINLEKMEYISFFEIISYILEKLFSYIILLVFLMVVKQVGIESSSNEVQEYIYIYFVGFTLSIQLMIVGGLLILKGDALIIFKFNSKKKSIKLERQRRKAIKSQTNEQERRKQNELE